MKEDKKEKKEYISLDTMLNVGKKIKIANKEYTVCPVNIQDMHLVMDAGELYIPLDVEGEKKKELQLQLVGMNITDENMAKNFFYVLEKYARYNDSPVTKELITEHNWSFKDIKEFLQFWAQIVSD